MTVRATRWVLPLAFTVLASLVGGTSRAPAADDVRPPTLVCVDGLLTRVVPRPGERLFRRRRWFCDVDGQANGVCTFGRRCRVCSECPIPSIRCHVTVPVPVGQEQQEGGVILACTATSTPTPCGPTLTCDTANRGVRGPPGRRPRRLLCLRARARRVRGGSDLSLRGRQPV